MMQIECLNSGDRRAAVLLGPQKLPPDGEKIRKSRFVCCQYSKGRYLLFHTLTRQLLALPPQLIDYFEDGRLFEASILSDGIVSDLYRNYFLVPQNAAETELYLELKDLLVIKEELPRSITHYVVLPTSACNARCFYCFEQGMRYQKMSEETLEDTLRFILWHRPEGQGSIHLHWFGGEPLCAADHIRRISRRLTEAGVRFDAEMTSNGSLFTEDLAQEAAEAWKLSRIQITLDGMAEEYARRKRYAGGPADPFRTVIRNIHFLLRAGIRVTIRLNTDENNLGEIYRTAGFLRDEFTEEERKNMHVYAHSLFAGSEDGQKACPAGSGSDRLEARVLEINDYIQRLGLSVLDLSGLFTLSTHFCKVTAPECNVLIDAAGRLFACDAMKETMCYGDVKTGIDPEAWKQVTAPCPIREECKACAFLPECTEFDRCPNRVPFDACRRQKERELHRKMRIAHEIYMDQAQQAAEKNNT